MKSILSKTLKSGYKLSIQFQEGGPLGVRLDNSKDEFVGQLFVSFKTIGDTVERLSNYELKLSESELKKIKSEVVKTTSKNESNTKMSSIRTLEESANQQLERFVI